MKSIKNKINAEKNIAVGTAKQKVGDLVGNQKLKDEGTRDRVKGNVQNAVEGVKKAAREALK